MLEIYFHNKIAITSFCYNIFQVFCWLRIILLKHFDKYDCREFPLPRIDFNAFIKKGDTDENPKSTTTKMNKNTEKAMKKIITQLIDEYGGIRQVQRQFNVSRDFIRKFKEIDVNDDD